MGIEPTTFGLKGRYSAIELRRYGGIGGPRTRDIRFKRPVLYQLSYDSIKLRSYRNTVLWHPRQESNPRLVGRNHPPYPLDYGGIGRAGRARTFNRQHIRLLRFHCATALRTYSGD